MIARWLSRRIEMRTRRLSCSVRDYDRIQWRHIHAAYRHARGLRLYAAWSVKERETMNYGAIVPLQSQSTMEEQESRKAA